MNPKIRKFAVLSAKNLFYRFKFLSRFWLPYHKFNVSVPVLLSLCEFIDQTRALNGPVMEIGCASGETTVFLNKFMDAEKIDKPYFAVDTFSGFVQSDMDYEASNRGKTRQALKFGFVTNSKAWFDRAMAINGILRVQSIQADVNQYDFQGMENISLCFIDVDLYKPVQSALRKIYPKLAPGGIIVVHDCIPDSIYDGSYQAYLEFIGEHKLPNLILHSEIGVIKKG